MANLLTLTPAEMLALWCERRLLITNSTTASVGHPYPDAVDSLLEAEIDAWYRQYLLTAPPDLCPVDDIASTVTVKSRENGSCTLLLPASTLRVTKVRLQGWSRDALIIASPTIADKARQNSPFTRAGRNLPVALLEGRLLHLFPDSGIVETLETVTDDTSSYTFAAGALADLHPIADITSIS